MYRALVFTSSILPSQSNPFVDMLEKSSAEVEKQSGVTMVLLNFAQLYRHFKVQRHEFLIIIFYNKQVFNWDNLPIRNFNIPSFNFLQSSYKIFFTIIQDVGNW